MRQRLLLYWLISACCISLYAHDNNPFTEFRIRTQRGAEYLQKGQFYQAESCYHAAVVRMDSVDKYFADLARINLARVYSLTGRFTQADSLLCMIHGEKDMVRTHRSANYIFSNDASAAIRLLPDSVLEVMDEPWQSVARQNRGYAYWQQKNYKMAEPDLERAIKTLAPPVLYATMANLAIVKACMSQYDSALAMIDSAINHLNISSEDYRICIRKRASILLMMQDIQRAEQQYRLYFTNCRTHLIENFAQMTEQNRLDFWKKEKPLLSEIFALENHAPDFLLDVALFRREVALLGRADSVNIPHRLAITGRDVRAKMQKDEVSIDFVRYIKNDTVWYGAIVVPSLRSGRKVRFVSLCTEQDMDDFRTEIYAVSGEESKSYIYENRTLAHLIWDRLLPYMKDAKHIYFAPDGILHMLAIEYLYPLIDENPSVSLHRLTSISRLLDRKPRKPICQQKILAVGGLRYSRLYAQHDSLGLHHEAASYFSRVTNAAPWFNSLSGALQELQQIDSIHTGDASANTIMTEGMLHRLWRDTSYTITHFATHGYALHVDVPAIPYMMRDSITEDQSLWASGIAMSGANKAYQRPCGEDAIVSAREICDMDLRHIDLMVVSACQGAQGHVADEGPAGLVRGLKKAGVRTVVATLWAINDESTSLLMGEFYRQLKTCSPTEAMRRAQKYVREYESLFPYYWDPACMCYRNVKPWDVQRMTRVRRFESPYYWAAFLVIDDI